MPAAPEVFIYEPEDPDFAAESVYGRFPDSIVWWLNQEPDDLEPLSFPITIFFDTRATFQENELATGD